MRRRALQGSNSPRAIRACLFVVSLMFGPPQAALLWAQQDAAGFVVQVGGQWELIRRGASRPETVAVRTMLRVGDELRRAPGTTGAFVIVALYSGEVPRHTDAFVVTAPERPGRIGLLVRTLQSYFRESFI